MFWATGAALFIRADLFHKIGGFDGDYFAHMEEIDLCWRLKRAGYKVMIQPQSVVYHVGGGTLQYTSPRKTFLNFRNSYYTLLKNVTTQKLFWLLPLRLFLDAGAGLLFLSQGKLAHIAAIARAHWTFFAQFGTIRKKRKHDQELIDRISIHPHPNRTGIYAGSLVWQYYFLRKRVFRALLANSK
ncbi:MAG: glycosyltransferase family 2 protein [Bacteroidota bacterium]